MVEMVVMGRTCVNTTNIVLSFKMYPALVRFTLTNILARLRLNDRT